MQNFFQDLRFSFRVLARAPGFTAAAIVVLALGIGANTAVFSLVHELLWSSRPFSHPEQIVQLYTQDKKNPGNFRLCSYPVYRELAAQNSVFDGILAHNLAMVGIGEKETSRRTFSAIVSANYFSVLGVSLAEGRAFLPEEAKPGSNIPVVIASHLYWKKTGFDPALVGKTIRVNERAYTVVGITPQNFTGTMMLFGPELYFPLGVFDSLANDFESHRQNTLERKNAFNLFLVGRLKAGVTPQAADAALRTIAAQLETAFPVEQKEQTMIVGALPRLSTNTNPSSENQLTLLGGLLLAMAGIVLAIACLNLANMLLARGTSRRKEIAIRLALGAGRGRIVRQLLTEGFVLALGGGVAGLLLAIWSAGLLVNSLTALMPIAMFFRGAANPAIFGATLAFCAFATLFFALGPALKLTPSEITSDLKEQSGEDPVGSHVHRRWWPRHPLLVAQIALSLALLTGAGLFVRGALNAARLDTGFDARNTLIAEVDASLGGYDRTQAVQLYRAINDRLSGLPGVQESSVGAIVPFGMITIEREVRRAGLNLAPDAHPASAADGLAFSARWTSTGARYFAAMGLPLLQGRPFTALEAENEGAPPVAIIDEVLANKLYPEGNALGQRIQWADREAAKNGPPKTIEIVGIVPVTRWELFRKQQGGNIYVPFAQEYQSNAFFHVRSTAHSAEAQRALIETVRREVRAVAPNIPLFSVKSFQRHLDSSVQLWTVRAGAALFGLFGGLALLLAVVGIYGVKAYAVSRRTREIGIRMALGAEAHVVQRMILREGLAMTLTGITLGLALGIGVGQAVAGLLYQVSAFDPITFTLAPLVLAAAAMLACWMPARRATRISPMAALRTE
ncbi:MAG: ABC transporter permease [Opitutus sp.]